MALATESVRVENRSTSPDWEVDAEGAEGPECGDGTGEGYARYELSADGERAATANVHRRLGLDGIQ